MFFYQDLLCPVCRAPFQDGEDIVACPDCGAPHHRDCWKQNGRCFYEQFHGTPEQWNRDTAEKVTASEAHRCPQCGAENSDDAVYCEHCGTLLEEPPRPTQEPSQTFRQTYREQFGQFVIERPDPTGGVPHDEMIDGVSAEDLANAVGPRSVYYVPRFKRIAAGRRFSWNWGGFLFPIYWLLLRKQYLWGGVFAAIQVLSRVFSAVVLLPYAQAIGAEAGLLEALMQMSEAMANALWTGSDPLLTVAEVIVMLLPLINLLIGFFGNYLYERTLVRRITRYRTDHPLCYPEELQRLGGISLIAPIICYFALQFLPEIILRLIV